jgi:hypothetical protein
LSRETAAGMLRGQMRPAPGALHLSAPGTSSATRLSVRVFQSGIPAETNVEVELLRPSAAFPTAREAERTWLRFRDAHWPREGRDTRIARALQALDSAVIDYGLDFESLRLIVEDADLEVF